MSSNYNIHQNIQGIEPQNFQETQVASPALEQVALHTREETMAAAPTVTASPTAEAGQKVQKKLLSPEISGSDSPKPKAFSLQSVKNFVKNSLNSLRDSLVTPSERAFRQKIQMDQTNAKLLIDTSATIYKLSKQALPDTQLSKWKLQEEIKTTMQVAAKNLNFGEIKKVKHEFGDHKIIVYLEKNAAGKLDVAFKVRKLGEGGFGKVNGAIRLTGEKIALKISIRKGEFSSKDMTDLVTEVSTAAALGSHKGVQGLLKIRQYKTDDPNHPRAGQSVVIGKWFSNGDLEKPVAKLNLLNFLGGENNRSSNLHRNIESKMQQLQQFYQERMEKKDSIQKNPSLTSVQRQIEISKIHDEIAQELEHLGQISSQLTNDDKAIPLKRSITSFMNGLRNDTFPSKEKQDAAFDNLYSRKNPSSIFNNMNESLHKTLQNRPPPMKKRLALAQDLMTGFNYMSSKGIFNPDIKPGNFFWNDQEAVHADFGGALALDSIKNKKSDPSKSNELEERPYIAQTPGYFPGPYASTANHYADQAIKLRNEGKIQEAAKFEKLWGDALKAGSQRAMGISLYQLLTGTFIPEDNPAYYDSTTYDAMQAEMVKKNVPERAAAIIAKMARPQVEILEKDEALSSPHYYKVKKYPDEFPPQVTEAELKELVSLLKFKKD